MIFSNKEVRRQDRVLEQKRASEILENGEYGVLSMQAEEGVGAYGVPLNYVWNGDNSLYIHCAPEGRKLRCVDLCSKVSFCVVGRTNIIAEKFTTGYESVVLCCTAHYHLSEEERRKALDLFVAKYCPEYRDLGKIYAEKSFHRTEIIRLDIEAMSGKSKKLF